MVHFRTTADPFCMFLTVNLKCSRYFSKCLVFLETRKTAFSFLLATSFYIITTSYSTKERRGPGQGRHRAGALTQPPPAEPAWGVHTGHLKDDSLLRIVPSPLSALPRAQAQAVARGAALGLGHFLHASLSATATRPV